MMGTEEDGNKKLLDFRLLLLYSNVQNMKGNTIMRKMGYALLFLLILAVLVFAGCKGSFTIGGKGSGDATDAADVSATGESDTAATVPYDPAAEASEIVHELEGLTDENGVTVYSPDEISSFVDQELNTAATVPQPSEAPVTAAPTTQAPAQPTGTSEYDVLRSGNFYAIGTMNDGTTTNPMEIAITPNSIYMATKMDNIDMSLLQSNGALYMIYPAGKMYLEVNAAIQNMMGFNADEMMNASEMGFGDMPALSEATTVADGELNGTACKIYTFDKGGARTVVYMSGSKLLCFENVEGNSRSATYITSITANVPADKINPPSGYKKANLIQFMTAMSGVL